MIGEEGEKQTQLKKVHTKLFGCVCVCCFAAKKVNDTCLFVSLGSHTHTHGLITGHSLSAIVPSLSNLCAATFRNLFSVSVFSGFVFSSGICVGVAVAVGVFLFFVSPLLISVAKLCAKIANDWMVIRHQQ